VPDHQRDLSFGTFLFPKSSAGPDLLRLARLAEDLGYDLIAAPDHPYWGHYLDGWTFLSAVFGATSSIQVFTDVINLSLRQPAVVAKAAWSLEAMAPGRLKLGIGSGGVWDAIAGIGGPVWSPREAFEHVEDAVSICRLIWSGEAKVSFAGHHHVLSDATPPPAPPRPIDLWIGCGKPTMRRLVAREADGWIPNGDGIEPENLRRASDHLDQELAAVDRPPHEVRRICNTIMKKLQPKSERFLFGPAEQWVDELSALAIDFGFDTFVFGDRDTTEEHLHRFAETVVPGVRENVASSRAAARSTAAGGTAARAVR
jgi:alkanesulfonate monooxygenase SsuD/methylene tetrahydromethanopterin reductase-like flavin-dependent oxidoreductase (luciferase family)